jgi:hypothetical protein
MQVLTLLFRVNTISKQKTNKQTSKQTKNPGQFVLELDRKYPVSQRRRSPYNIFIY